MKSARQLALLIVQRANDGYQHRRDGYPEYPPFAIAPWDDRIKWSKYIETVAEKVLAEELGQVLPVGTTHETR